MERGTICSLMSDSARVDACGVLLKRLCKIHRNWCLTIPTREQFSSFELSGSLAAMALATMLYGGPHAMALDCTLSHQCGIASLANVLPHRCLYGFGIDSELCGSQLRPQEAG
jgi:hypothetical protein